MFSSTDRADFNALLAELHSLMQAARARGDLAVHSNGFLPDYWYGVATGYQDAADRIEVILRNLPPAV